MTTTWNPSDITGQATLSNGNLTATANSGTGPYVSGRGTTSKALSSGKWYFEVTVTILNATNQAGVGVADSTAALTNYIGDDAHGVAVYQSSGVVYNGAALTPPTWLPNGKPAVIGIAIDTGGKLFWGKVVGGDATQTVTGWNQTSSTGSNSPVTGVGGQAYAMTGNLFPTFTFGAAGNVATINAGGSAFTGTVPTGYSSWDPSVTTVALSAISSAMAKAFGSLAANLALSASASEASAARGSGSFAVSLRAAAKEAASGRGSLLGSAALQARSGAQAKSAGVLSGQVQLLSGSGRVATASSGLILPILPLIGSAKTAIHVSGLPLLVQTNVRGSGETWEEQIGDRRRKKKEALQRAREELGIIPRAIVVPHGAKAPIVKPKLGTSAIVLARAEADQAEKRAADKKAVLSDVLVKEAVAKIKLAKTRQVEMPNVKPVSVFEREALQRDIATNRDRIKAESAVRDVALARRQRIERDDQDVMMLLDAFM